MARKNPRLPPIIDKDIEIMPANAHCRIYFKSPNGATFRVEDRRKKPSPLLTPRNPDPFWLKASQDWTKEIQYIPEDTHFGGEDMAMLFRNTFPSYVTVDIPDISAKDFFTSAFDEALNKVQKDIDKINKEARKASRKIRDSLDLSKRD